MTRHALAVAAGILLLTAAGIIALAVTGSQPTPILSLSPAGDSTVQWVELYCPTANEEARRYYNEGNEYRKVGQMQRSEEAYLMAIEVDPRFCDAMDNLGLLLRSQGRIDEAIAWYQRSLRVLPSNPVARQNLAFAYARQGRNAEAIAEYEKLIEIHPGNPEGYHGLGSVYLDMQRPREALPRFEKAEALYAKDSSPLVADARYQLGVAYLMLQDWATARRYLEQSLSRFVEHPRANLYLGIACLQLGDLESARWYLGKAKSLGAQIPTDILQRVGL